MKRQNAAGSVHYDKSSKKWVARVRAVDPRTGKVRQLGKRVRATEVEAHQALEELKAQVDAEAATINPDVRIGAMVDRWVEAKSTSWSAATRRRHVHRLAYLDPIRDMIADRVVVDDLERHFATLAAGGVSTDDLRRLRQDLSAAWDRALARGQVADRRNPADLAELPDPRAHQPAEQRPGRALTRPEVDAMVVAAKTQRLGIAIPMMFFTGLRPSEARALRWDAVDLEAGTLSVEGQLGIDADGKPVATRPKTRRSLRTIHLPAVVVDALTEHRAAQDSEAALGLWPAEWDGLVLRTQNGTPIDASGLRRLFRVVAAAAGIEGTVKPYDARTTATTLLVAAGVPHHEVADHLGHVDLRMIERNYRQRPPVAGAGRAFG